MGLCPTAGFWTERAGGGPKAGSPGLQALGELVEQGSAPAAAEEPSRGVLPSELQRRPPQAIHGGPCPWPSPASPEASTLRPRLWALLSMDKSKAVPCEGWAGRAALAFLHPVPCGSNVCSGTTAEPGPEPAAYPQSPPLPALPPGPAESQALRHSQGLFLAACLPGPPVCPKVLPQVAVRWGRGGWNLCFPRRAPTLSSGPETSPGRRESLPSSLGSRPGMQRGWGT